MRVADRCPECRSEDVARIVYGYPAGKPREPGTVDGGCRCWGDERDDQWICGDCGQRWGAVLPHSLSSIPDKLASQRALTNDEIRQVWVGELPWLAARWASASTELQT